METRSNLPPHHPVETRSNLPPHHPVETSSLPPHHPVESSSPLTARAIILWQVIKGVGGFTHKDWRAFSNDRKTCDATHVLDGDLIESFLSLTSAQMTQVRFEGDEHRSLSRHLISLSSHLISSHPILRVCDGLPGTSPLSHPLPFPTHPIHTVPFTGVRRAARHHRRGAHQAHRGLGQAALRRKGPPPTAPSRHGSRGRGRAHVACSAPERSMTRPGGGERVAGRGRAMWRACFLSHAWM
jgi:hypothetical protein